MIIFEMDEASIRELVQNLEIVRAKVMAGAEAGIQNIADRVYNRAWNTCPVSSGLLRSSMYKELEVTADEVRAHVGHGGNYNRLNPNTGKMTDDYAIEVHESYKIRRENRERGATWKWLEKAVNRVKPEFEETLRSYISNSLEGL